MWVKWMETVLPKYKLCWGITILTQDWYKPESIKRKAKAESTLDKITLYTYYNKK